MNAKQRFRFRRKLTAALLQVVLTVNEMMLKRVATNRENLVTAGTVLRLLDDLITNGPVRDDARPLLVTPAGKAAVEAAALRRGRETTKRRRRKGYRNRGRIVVVHVGEPAARGGGAPALGQ